MASEDVKDITAKLMGAWISDKASTVPEVYKVEEWNDELKQIIIDNLGSLRNTFYQDRIVSQFGDDGEKIELFYIINDYGSDWVSIRIEESDSALIRFDGDGFWIEFEGARVNFRERFKKIQ